MKKPIAICCLMLSASLITSCQVIDQAYYDSVEVVKYTGLIDRHQIQRTGQWVLAPESSFYIALNPGMDQFSAQLSERVSRVLENAVRSQFFQVKRGDKSETYGYAAANAASSGYRYLVYPEILIWDNKVGSWTELAQILATQDSQGIVDSFGRDRVRLQIRLSESNSHRLVDLAFVEAESGLLSIYDNDPEQLLQGVVSEYFDSLTAY